MKLIKLTVILFFTINLTTHSAEDLKTYYEQKKVEIEKTFEAPDLGSQVTIKMASGQSRTGILMKLDTTSISLMTETGNATYQRLAMHESSRAFFFAEDYAHVNALEMTRQYKNELHKENLEEEAANTHEGSLSVNAKVRKSSDKDIEAEDRETNHGEKRTITTTTRTSTEVLDLNISVSNPTTHSDVYSVEYYFFSKAISKGGREQDKKDDSETEGVRLQNKSTKNITVPARSRASVSVSSDPFEVKKVEVDNGSGYSGNHAPRETGEESAGYVAILKHGSTVLDMKSSAKSYLNEEWLRKFR